MAIPRRRLEDESLTEADRVMRKERRLAYNERAVFSPMKQQHVRMRVDGTGGGTGFLNSEAGRMISIDREVRGNESQIKLHVTFEGSIASGKSTNMLALSEVAQAQGESSTGCVQCTVYCSCLYNSKSNYIFVAGHRTFTHFECITSWNCPKTKQNLIALSGKFPKLYSFPAQAAVMATTGGRTTTSKEYKDKALHLKERDLSSCWNVFVRARESQNYLDSFEMFALRTLYKSVEALQEEAGHKTGCIIVFHPPFMITWARLQERKQAGDAEIDVEYLKLIYDLYETWIEEEVHRGRELCVVREPLDGDRAAHILGECWMYILERNRAKGDWNIRTDPGRYKHGECRCLKNVLYLFCS